MANKTKTAKSDKNTRKSLDSSAKVKSFKTKTKDSIAKRHNGSSIAKASYPQMAEFGERFLAFFIDSLILGFAIAIVSNILSLLFLGGIFTGAAFSSSFFAFAFFPLILLGIVLSVAMTTLYYGYFYINKKGQSLGKKVLNIKVVKGDLKSQITWGDTFLREVVGKDFLNRLVFYLGYLWYFMSPKRQTWADSIAGTYVVKADSKGETLMGGSKDYPKKPLITFGWVGCMLIVFVLTITIFIGIVTFAVSKSAKQPKPIHNTNVEYRYNNQIEEPKDTNDALNEFKKVYEEEYNKSQDNSL